MTSKVLIERAPGGWVDRYRAYEVIVNGELRTELWRGEKRAIEVDPGEIEIFLRIDWCRSRILRIDASSESDIRLCCRSRSVLTIFYGITFGRDNYVQLEAI